MKVIIDTSVWSLALRRVQASTNNPYIRLLQDLIVDSRVALLGSVRQEILSGIRYAEQHDRLKNYLRAFPNIELDIEDYELASEFYNSCRLRGIQGANTYFLICATAVRRNYEILTVDKDFDGFRPYIPISLLEL